MQKVKIYTTPYCPYCIEAKRFLSQNNIPFEDFDVSNDQELRQKVSAENGHYRTVPMILVGDVFVGGYTELIQQAKSGNLEKLLED